MRAPRTEQPLVPPEALSWCISDFSKKAWTYNGAVLQKAHRVKEVEKWGRKWHYPLCGAWMHHMADDCSSVPGWPACRHCAKKLSSAGTIPEVFL